MLDFWHIWVYNKDTEREVLTMGIFNENTWAGTTESIVNDPYNQNNTRNLRNVDKAYYNCGGYALNLFSWYCPWDEDASETETPLARAYWEGNYFDDDEMFAPTMRCVQNMLAEIPTLRLLTGINDPIQKNEYKIAFRISYDGDFHFMKRADNGIWYHKQGGSEYIRKAITQEVLDVWCGRYNGPLVFFANTKK